MGISTSESSGSVLTAIGIGALAVILALSGLLLPIAIQSIDDLNDVTFIELSDGQIIVYDAETGNWTNAYSNTTVYSVYNLVIYANESIGIQDGNIWAANGDGNWTAAWNGDSERTLSAGGGSMLIEAENGLGWALVDRGFQYFNLSVIPSQATILAAEFTFYANYVGLSTPPNVSIQKGTQELTLSTADYNAYEGEIYGMVYVESATETVYSIPFNQYGLDDAQAAIGDMLKLAIREYDHDVLNTSPTSPTYYAALIRSAVQEEDFETVPYLNVSYMLRTHVTNLYQLGDVAITALENGQIIVYNSTSETWENVEQRAYAVSNLTDVSAVGLANGEILKYNSTSAQWENEAYTNKFDIYGVACVGSDGVLYLRRFFIGNQTWDASWSSLGTSIRYIVDSHQSDDVFYITVMTNSGTSYMKAVNLTSLAIVTNWVALSGYPYTTNEFIIKASVPTLTFAGQVWIDTSGSEVVMRVRNKANTAWLNVTFTP